MCLQCLVDPYYFGQVIPGWLLIRARKDDYKDDPTEMAAGDWGLLRCNDPEIIWNVMPRLAPQSPSYGVSVKDCVDAQAELKRLEDIEDRYYKDIERFEVAIKRNSIDTTFELMTAGVAAGYDPEERGFAEWLFNRIAEHIAVTEPTIDEENPSLVPSNPIKLMNHLYAGEIKGSVWVD